MDQDETWHTGRPRRWPQCVRWGSSPSPKGHSPLNFWPISVVAKWLDGSRCHLVGRPLPNRHCVRWGSSSPPQKWAELPVFGPCLLWPNGWRDQDGTWHGSGPRPRPNCPRCGPSSPSPKRRHIPQFSAHFHCGQMAGCIKMPFAMEVGLSPGDFVLDEDTAPPPQKGTQSPIFRPCPLWPNGWMD